MEDMKKKPGFTLRDVCGEQVIIADGKENIDFSKIISMNESSAYLWNSVGDDDFTAESLCKLLVEEYNIDEATALNDAENLLAQWHKAGIVG